MSSKTPGVFMVAPGRVSSLWLRAAAREPQEERAWRLLWARAELPGLPCEWARRRVKGCTALRCPGRPIRDQVCCQVAE